MAAYCLTFQPLDQTMILQAATKVWRCDCTRRRSPRGPANQELAPKSSKWVLCVAIAKPTKREAQIAVQMRAAICREHGGADLQRSIRPAARMDTNATQQKYPNRQHIRATARLLAWIESMHNCGSM